MVHQTNTDELAGKLRGMVGELERAADQLERAATDLDRLRSDRYRKWNQPDVIEDVLRLNLTPLDLDRIIQEMKRCGYEFQSSNTHPGRSVKINLSKLEQEGRVARETQPAPWPHGETVVWRVADRRE